MDEWGFFWDVFLGGVTGVTGVTISPQVYWVFFWGGASQTKLSSFSPIYFEVLGEFTPKKLSSTRTFKWFSSSLCKVKSRSNF